MFARSPLPPTGWHLEVLWACEQYWCDAPYSIISYFRVFSTRWHLWPNYQGHPKFRYSTYLPFSAGKSAFGSGLTESRNWLSFLLKWPSSSASLKIASLVSLPSASVLLAMVLQHVVSFMIGQQFWILGFQNISFKSCWGLQHEPNLTEQTRSRSYCYIVSSEDEKMREGGMAGYLLVRIHPRTNLPITCSGLVSWQFYAYYKVL